MALGVGSDSESDVEILTDVRHNLFSPSLSFSGWEESRRACLQQRFAAFGAPINQPTSTAAPCSNFRTIYPDACVSKQVCFGGDLQKHDFPKNYSSSVLNGKRGSLKTEPCAESYGRYGAVPKVSNGPLREGRLNASFWRESDPHNALPCDPNASMSSDELKGCLCHAARGLVKHAIRLVDFYELETQLPAHRTDAHRLRIFVGFFFQPWLSFLETYKRCSTYLGKCNCRTVMHLVALVKAAALVVLENCTAESVLETLDDSPVDLGAFNVFLESLHQLWVDLLGTHVVNTNEAFRNVTSSNAVKELLSVLDVEPAANSFTPLLQSPPAASFPSTSRLPEWGKLEVFPLSYSSLARYIKSTDENGWDTDVAQSVWILSPEILHNTETLASASFSDVWPNAEVDSVSMCTLTSPLRIHLREHMMIHIQPQQMKTTFPPTSTVSSYIISALLLSSAFQPIDIEVKEHAQVVLLENLKLSEGWLVPAHPQWLPITRRSALYDSTAGPQHSLVNGMWVLVTSSFSQASSTKRCFPECLLLHLTIQLDLSLFRPREVSVFSSTFDSVIRYSPMLQERHSVCTLSRQALSLPSQCSRVVARCRSLSHHNFALWYHLPADYSFLSRCKRHILSLKSRCRRAARQVYGETDDERNALKLIDRMDELLRCLDTAKVLSSLFFQICAFQEVFWCPAEPFQPWMPGDLVGYTWDWDDPNVTIFRETLEEFLNRLQYYGDDESVSAVPKDQRKKVTHFLRESILRARRRQAGETLLPFAFPPIWVFDHLIVRAIPATDPRERLHGQLGVFATRLIPANEILGFYVGRVYSDLREHHSEDVSPVYMRTFVASREHYEMAIKRHLAIDSSRDGNRLNFVNDYRLVPEASFLNNPLRRNCDIKSIFTLSSEGPEIPAFCASRDIQPGEELLTDYGEAYWAPTNPATSRPYISGALDTFTFLKKISSTWDAVAHNMFPK